MLQMGRIGTLIESKCQSLDKDGWRNIVVLAQVHEGVAPLLMSDGDEELEPNQQECSWKSTQQIKASRYPSKCSTLKLANFIYGYEVPCLADMQICLQVAGIINQLLL